MSIFVFGNGSQQGAIFSLGHERRGSTWQCLETVLVVATQKREARNATIYPTVHRIASTFHPQ